MATLKEDLLAVRLDAYLAAHDTEKLNAMMIADHLGIGKTQLYELSRQFYGCAVAEMIRSLRMERQRGCPEEGQWLLIAILSFMPVQCMPSVGLNDQLAGSAGTLSTDLTNINNPMAWVFDTLFSTVEDLTDLQLDVQDLSVFRGISFGQEIRSFCVTRDQFNIIFILGEHAIQRPFQHRIVSKTSAACNYNSLHPSKLPSKTKNAPPAGGSTFRIEKFMKNVKSKASPKNDASVFGEAYPLGLRIFVLPEVPVRSFRILRQYSSSTASQSMASMEPSEYLSSTRAESMLNSQDSNFFMMISSISLF